MPARQNSADDKEIAHFAKDSGNWWKQDGPFRPLHRLNPIRIGYIRERIVEQFGLEKNALKPFKDLKILDIGCGGGLVCESLARLAADVSGVDADAQAIEVAKAHAIESGLAINYLTGAAETLLSKNDLNQRYDVVLALEIVEHVTEPESFIQTCADLCKPGGVVIFSTLNRTTRSYALGIVAAEYILGWVPPRHAQLEEIHASVRIGACRSQGGIGTLGRDRHDL